MRLEGKAFTLILLPAESCGIISWLMLTQCHPNAIEAGIERKMVVNG